jgi:hypothetical protein
VTLYTRQSHYWYPQGAPNPRCDPTFLNRIADLLISNYRERVHIESLLGGDPWVIHDRIEKLRQTYGFVVVGNRGIAGYTLTDWAEPRREPDAAGDDRQLVLDTRVREAGAA